MCSKIKNNKIIIYNNYYSNSQILDLVPGRLFCAGVVWCTCGVPCKVVKSYTKFFLIMRFSERFFQYVFLLVLKSKNLR